MSTGRTPTPDPEDLFADTRMSFGDHLEELRMHLWRAIIGFGVALVISLFFGKPVLEFIAAPVERELGRFYDKRVNKVMKDLQKDPNQAANQPTDFVKVGFYRPQLEALLQGKPTEEINAFPRPVVKAEGEEAKKAKGWWPFGGDDDDEAKAQEAGEVRFIPPTDVLDIYMNYQEPLKQVGILHKAQQEVGRRPALSTLNVQEAFMVYFKVSMMCGLVLGSPWIFYQIWSFIAAGLYPHEKRYVHVYLPFSLGLFLAGVFVCEFFVIPKAIEALLWFNEWIGLEPDLRLNEWLGFAIAMPLVFGVSFQTPLVMLFLERLGILHIDTYRRKRRMAWFVMAIFAAVITPSTDAISMLFLWVPMSLLFELGIFLCKMSPHEPDLGIDLPDSEELVEV